MEAAHTPYLKTNHDHIAVVPQINPVVVNEQPLECIPLTCAGHGEMRHHNENLKAATETVAAS
jgi:hypothetical protein